MATFAKRLAQGMTPTLLGIHMLVDYFIDCHHAYESVTITHLLCILYIVMVYLSNEVNMDVHL